MKLDSYDKKISIAFNLISNTLGKKDIIKIEDKSLSKEEINQLSILSPRITINIIKNYQVRKKYNLEIPKEIKGIFLCQNKTCITHSESIPSHFYIASTPYHIYGTCKYCEQQFNMIEGTHNL